MFPIDAHVAVCWLLFLFFNSWGIWACLPHLCQESCQEGISLLYHSPWWSGGFCWIPALFVTAVKLHCFNPHADSLFVFLLGSCSKYNHCLWLCLHFWRFRSALVHTLACKLVLCNPPCFYLAWYWHSCLWAQLQGEEHWSFLFWFLIKTYHFPGEFQFSFIAFARVIVLVAFLPTISFNAVVFLLYI